MRILGIDVGLRRVGVAISDELGITAQPLISIDLKKSQKDVVDEIAAICKEREVSVVVVGIPLAMDGGDRGQSARFAKKMGESIKECTGAKVEYWDERFTTREAQRVLIEADVSRKNRKAVVDKVAAALILQGYLDARKNR